MIDALELLAVVSLIIAVCWSVLAITRCLLDRKKKHPVNPVVERELAHYSGGAPGYSSAPRGPYYPMVATSSIPTPPSYDDGAAITNVLIAEELMSNQDSERSREEPTAPSGFSGFGGGESGGAGATSSWSDQSPSCDASSSSTDSGSCDAGDGGDGGSGDGGDGGGDGGS
jgi:uncharacterized membrane protein YgcG